ncbi:MAG TPA: hypothetical protein VGE39_17230 [Prosthecobacter sp.]
MKTILFLLMAGLCGCLQRPYDSGAWSINPAHRGKSLFEGAQMGWHGTAQDDDS